MCCKNCIDCFIIIENLVAFLIILNAYTTLSLLREEAEVEVGEALT